MAAPFSSALKRPDPPAPKYQHASASEWMIVVGWAALMFTLSTSYFSAAVTQPIITAILHFVTPWMSSQTAATIAALTRKLAHFTEYGVFYWLLLRGPCFKRPGLALIICLIYAASDETHQMFVAGRTPSPFDVGIDFSGALFSRFLHLMVVEA